MTTAAECVRAGEARLLAGPHAERARRDAERLLQVAIGWDRAALIARWNEPVRAEAAEHYGELIKRRAAGEPIQYIVGEQEFYGLPFRVTADVLIPRPETEHLVERAIAWAGTRPEARIVDVGTGSGAIAVALAHALPQGTITAIDISEAALAIARENATRNGVNVRLLRGDLLEPVTGESFDAVVSNPPYVSTRDRDGLSVEVRAFEPELALFAGEDGLDMYRRLIPAAFKVLTPGGLCALEIGHEQSLAVGDLMIAAGFRGIEFVEDLQGIPRVACGVRQMIARHS